MEFNIWIPDNIHRYLKKNNVIKKYGPLCIRLVCWISLLNMSLMFLGWYLNTIIRLGPEPTIKMSSALYIIYTTAIKSVIFFYFGFIWKYKDAPKERTSELKR